MRVALVLLLTFLLWPNLALGWPATVMNVYDGDTITVAPAGDEECQLFVKLYGVDAPELKQKFGPEAKKWLADKLKIRTLVEIIPMHTDPYGRIIAFVALNGRILNRELVSQGYAWVTKACQAMVCRSFTAQQKQASSEHLGLWADEKAVAPWVWSQREQFMQDKLPLTPSQSSKNSKEKEKLPNLGLPDQIFGNKGLENLGVDGLF